LRALREGLTRKLKISCISPSGRKIVAHGVSQISVNLRLGFTLKLAYAVL
jgi:hypothetical protein